MKKARYYQKNNGEVTCILCPHTCTIKPGERGKCRVRKNKDGELYSTVYGKPTAAHLDPIEKKPLFHFLPGEQAYSIGTAGCNQRCKFCQNWRMSQKNEQETTTLDLPPEKVVENTREKKAKIIAYTYNEPTVYMEYMQDTAKKAKQKNLKNIAVTCGLVNKKPLIDLTPDLDAANIDLKFFSDELYSEVSGGYLKPVLETIKTLKEEGVWIEITNLVIPGLNDDEEMIREMSRWIVNNVGKEVPLHLSRFYPAYKMKNKSPTSIKTVKKAEKIAREEGINHVYIGNIPGERRNTECPECGNTVIDRTGRRPDTSGLKNGKCRECGRKIPGVWG